MVIKTRRRGKTFIRMADRDEDHVPGESEGSQPRGIEAGLPRPRLFHLVSFAFCHWRPCDLRTGAEISVIRSELTFVDLNSRDPNFDMSHSG